MNVIQGCNCCDDCTTSVIGTDDFNRANLNFGGPFTWIGNPGVFSLVSNRLQCSTSDRYIVTSGLATPVGGQSVHFDISSGLTGNVFYVLTNWVDTNNFDFARLTTGTNALELYSRVSGSDTLMQGGPNLSPYNSVTVYRWGTYMAAVLNFAAGPRYKSVSDGFPAMSSSPNAGIRIHTTSGAMQFDNFDYDDCPDYDGRVTACDEFLEESVQVQVTLSDFVSPCTNLNGVWVLDPFVPQYRGGSWVFSSGGITISVSVEFDITLNEQTLVVTAQNGVAACLSAGETDPLDAIPWPMDCDHSESLTLLPINVGGAGGSALVEFIPA